MSPAELEWVLGQVDRQGPGSLLGAVGRGYHLAKRVMDIVLGTLLLAATLPVSLLAALAIKLTSRGPVFFRQHRVGLNGRVFTMYKFRSMRAGAEETRLDLSYRNEMTGPVFPRASRRHVSLFTSSPRRNNSCSASVAHSSRTFETNGPT